MFNRRFLRVKILQALYAYFQSDNTDVKRALAELHHSVERAFDLVLYLLLLPVELKNMERLHMEGQGRKSPESKEINNGGKFLGNQIIQKFERSDKLRKLAVKRGINWASERSSVQKFYKLLKQSDSYRQYMQTTAVKYGEDRKFISSIYGDLLSGFDLFFHNFEEKSIYWDEDDCDYAVFIVLNMLKKLSYDKELDSLTKLAYENREDREFVEKLFKKTVASDKLVEETIARHTKNWDPDRIALIDMILMKMAITEILNFSEIPVKVSMNEYIDIAKAFSTPKSSQFINGIIDKVVLEFKDGKRIKKSGRGLKE